MRKTAIEYGINPDGSRGYAWNPYPGCNHWQTGICVVKECWAKRMAHQYHWDFEPHLIPERLLEPLTTKRPGRVLVNFMGDLFGDLVDPEMKIIIPITFVRYDRDGILYNHSLRQWVFQALWHCPQHQFFFLTKAPWNIAKWGKFPENAWVGATVCSQEMLKRTYMAFRDVSAFHLWLSFEPLLESV